MRRNCRRYSRWLIVLGISILLAMLLPSDFWIVLTGFAFVAAGLALCRR